MTTALLSPLPDTGVLLRGEGERAAIVQTTCKVQGLSLQAKLGGQLFSVD